MVEKGHTGNLERNYYRLPDTGKDKHIMVA